MNNIFQFIQDKKGKPIPLKYKLLNNIPLTKNDVTYDGNLSLYNSNITYLPDNLTINGNLELSLSKIKYLPDNLYVGGNLFCKHTPLANNIKNDTSLLNKYSKQVKGKIFYEW